MGGGHWGAILFCFREGSVKTPFYRNRISVPQYVSFFALVGLEGSCERFSIHTITQLTRLYACVSIETAESRRVHHYDMLPTTVRGVSESSRTVS